MSRCCKNEVLPVPIDVLEIQHGASQQRTVEEGLVGTRIEGSAVGEDDAAGGVSGLWCRVACDDYNGRKSHRCRWEPRPYCHLSLLVIRCT